MTHLYHSFKCNVGTVKWGGSALKWKWKWMKRDYQVRLAV